MKIDETKLLELVGYIIESYAPWEHQQRVRARELLAELKAARAPATEQPVEKSDLLPCPFCGSQGLLDDSCADRTVSCSECGAQPRQLPLHHDQTKREAYAVWNTRATPERETQQPDDCREAFEKWVIETVGSLYAPVSAWDAWEAAWDLRAQRWQGWQARTKRDPAGCVACGHSFDGHYDSCRYSERELNEEEKRDAIDLMFQVEESLWKDKFGVVTDKAKKLTYGHQLAALLEQFEIRSRS